MLGFILASMEEMKAEETVTIDLSDKSSIGEVMVVATGRSNVHLASIADRVVKDLKARASPASASKACARATGC